MEGLGAKKEGEFTEARDWRSLVGCHEMQCLRAWYWNHPPKRLGLVSISVRKVGDTQCVVSLWFSLRTSNFKGYSVESLTGTLQGLKRLSKPLQVVPRGGQEIGRLEGFCLTGFSPAIDLQWRVSFSLGFLDSAR